ncbi:MULTISPECIES: hypothetical protein [unclassified Streptomyces]|uniref:hypothetical protein n=1 Tax=unclassified Streptomyces TaxID=2593676 RepID=UPI002DDAD05E|nr:MULTISPECIES: hypothetical protein [unclassified Streptomyces]WSB75718.1 hypothetical protein OHB04_07885 [Streptomyces sp. NBC_01775]WSS15997.1 hypothetical protein OG533_32000 [Streptomyces sp. NBC_01186]WSS44815.1 hypothetical protein OG220_32680 [Streptomyces sp. NBC_01187]
MTAHGSRATTVRTFALALTLTLAVAGCGGGGDDGDGGGKARADASASSGTSSPAPETGTGKPSSPPAPSTTAPSPSSSGGTPKGGIPKPGDVDQGDADAVGEGTLKAMWTSDTTIDSGPQDATVRTADAGWLSEKYEKQLRGHRSRSAPGAQWEKWTHHRAYTKVEVAKTEDAARPDDTDTEAWRQWTVTTTPHGRDGWKPKPTTVAAYVQLVRSAPDADWRVAGVTVQ